MLKIEKHANMSISPPYKNYRNHVHATQLMKYIGKPKPANKQQNMLLNKKKIILLYYYHLITIIIILRMYRKRS